MRVLIAEDDQISRRLLKAYLEQMGHEVVEAADGQQAWDAYQADHVRLVVSDWLMPSMDGLELCQKIRSLPNPNYTYFIMVTANVSEESNYVKAMDAGVDDFLWKPIDRHQLTIRIRVAERIIRSTSRIQSLESVLTICAYTKKINFPAEGWQTIEEFMDKHLGIQVTHGVEPRYYDEVIKPQLEELKKPPKPTEE